MTEKKWYTTKEVQEITGLRQSQLNYVITDNRINLQNVIQPGAGRSRKFNKNSIAEIKNYYKIED